MLGAQTQAAAYNTGIQQIQYYNNEALQVAQQRAQEAQQSAAYYANLAQQTLYQYGTQVPTDTMKDAPPIST